MNNRNKRDSIVVSVIIPCFNMEKYVSETLQSVLQQNFSKMEIICLNDGSTDHTEEILHGYQKRYPCIKVISSPHRGVSYQRNLGISIAEGQFVHYLDADDLLHPDFYQLMVQYMNEKNLELLYCEGEAFYETDDLIKRFPYFTELYHRKNVYNGVYSGEELYVKFRKNRDWIVQPCMQLIRKSYLKKTQILFPDIPMLEDNTYVIKTMLKAKRIGCLPDRLYYRRVREQSLMTSTVTIDRVYSLLIVSEDITKLADVYREKKLVYQMMGQQINYYQRECRRLFSLLSEVEQRTLKRKLSDSQLQIIKSDCK